MKPQKKAAVARKATRMPTIAKKRRFLEKTVSDVRKEKKTKKLEEARKKTLDSDKRKSDQEKKKSEDGKKKLDEKRTVKEKIEKLDKVDDRKKNCPKDHEKKVDEKKILDKPDEKMMMEEFGHQDTIEKKKSQKVGEEKTKVDKQIIDSKKKPDKVLTVDEKTKKNGKFDDENFDNQAAVLNLKEILDENKKDEPREEKVDKEIGKKKCKDDKKKDNSKPIKVSVIKDKKSDRKKIGKKDSKSKSVQKKEISKKTVLTKKSHLSIVQKLVDKNIKPNKLLNSEETTSVSEEDESVKKTKRKSAPSNASSKTKKPKLGKSMKAKLPLKNNKISTDKLRTLVDKIVPKKKIESKEPEKSSNEKKLRKDESNEETDVTDTKSDVKEVEDNKEIDKVNKEEQVQSKSQEVKKNIGKSVSKSSEKNKKVVKKKPVKLQENISQSSSSSEDTSSEELKQTKTGEGGVDDGVPSKQEIEDPIEEDFKDECEMNGDNGSSNSVTSESEDYSDEDSRRKNRDYKKRSRSPSDERFRRMRLFGFWNGPKRHRVASLNALAKVHCLYENETGGVYLGGFCKPKPEKERQKKSKEEIKEKEKEKEKKVETKTEESTPKRKLRNVPGLRGKHWDMLESSSSSSSSSSDEEYEKEKSVENSGKKRITKRRKKEEVMDLKDMVVCKRMASLNASAILAASYSDEKHLRGSSSSDSSSESEVEIIKRRKQNDSDIDKRKSRQNAEQDDVLKPSNKLVILNQDTDVTITGVYVNQTRSTTHEGFCSIAGMQYRISSTSHTQTAATAVATELHDQQKLEQPCKSYTPLGALSSMQPPGSQGSHPNMSPRRHSAFSAPHQHGYYQPAGPLIQHPPTLPPIKGPPPEPTPTPPQNSEGSDDLVATSTTSGGTSSTGGGFYRAYCPQYYGTPPQYPDLCYPPTYSHPHAHPPPYYKYPPTYRRYFFRQYYGYQESGGGGGPGGGATAGGPAVVDYQPPPPPGEYPLPPYYGAYPPPPPPPPPPPNPAYLHTQGRPFVDHAAFQGCPCPMQSCPKNVDTGPLIGNGKGAPVVSGPGLSLPPSALVGPPSPARGLAGLAPPHGANAWDTDRVQLNTHRNLNQNQSQPTTTVPASRNVANNRQQNTDCKKDEKNCSKDSKIEKCGCQKHACTSNCEVKMENLSPSEKLSVTTCPGGKYGHNFKLENNNVKCESCSVEIGDNLSCVANCNVKCESDYKCDIMKCEQCMKEGQMAILEIDKDSGILLDEKLDADDVKEELMNDVAVPIENDNWKKPDYEPTVQEETLQQDESDGDKSLEKEVEEEPQTEQPRCQKVSKRKLSLDSLSDSRKKRKVSKRTLSVGSSQDLNNGELVSPKISLPALCLVKKTDSNSEDCASRKKQIKKDATMHNQKRKVDNSMENASAKKSKTSKQAPSNNILTNCVKQSASDNSIMETIDNVIQQSLQMTQKKDRKSKTSEKSERSKKVVNLLSAVKKVTKKIDLVSGKLSKNAQSKSNKYKSKSKSKNKSKSKSYETKTKDSGKKQAVTAKSKAAVCIDETRMKQPALIKKKQRKNTKKPAINKKSGSKLLENCSTGNEHLVLTRKMFLKPKWSNGWSWEGDPFEAKVYLTNEESAIRRCYASMKHESGDVLRPRDCVLLKSGPRKADLPFVAKIAALWENPDDGEMMFSLLWYYRPEHTEQGRTQYDTADEVFASRHRDANSVACIEDKCYILTFNEYCRYRKNLRRIEEGLESPGLIVPPGDQVYPRESCQPPIPVPSDMVLFCRRVYDYRGKKLVKNPG
ncbi:uncharacterized protein LOC108632416 [Ceratina calcarata]|uniref:Uncharacterized protein LOC108632416 n=1 Tax=Ceratina calcarata TaxID=156304 RepID=A0AAJ7NF99_9HYME|nr:uncharacterized protein LOC108632416 [Ceratina calcarata]